MSYLFLGLYKYLPLRQMEYLNLINSTKHIKKQNIFNYNEGILLINDHKMKKKWDQERLN